MKLKPIVDLTLLYQGDCLLKNPNYVEDVRVTDEVCQKVFALIFIGSTTF